MGIITTSDGNTRLVLETKQQISEKIARSSPSSGYISTTHRVWCEEMQGRQTEPEVCIMVRHIISWEDSAKT